MGVPARRRGDLLPAKVEQIGQPEGLEQSSSGITHTAEPHLMTTFEQHAARFQKDLQTTGIDEVHCREIDDHRPPPGREQGVEDRPDREACCEIEVTAKGQHVGLPPGEHLDLDMRLGFDKRHSSSFVSQPARLRTPGDTGV